MSSGSIVTVGVIRRPRKIESARSRARKSGVAIPSWIAFASCFLAIGLALEAQGLAAAFALGVLAAVATTVLVLWIDRHLASSSGFENRA